MCRNFVFYKRILSQALFICWRNAFLMTKSVCYVKICHLIFSYCRRPCVLLLLVKCGCGLKFFCLCVSKFLLFKTTCCCTVFLNNAKMFSDARIFFCCLHLFFGGCLLPLALGFLVSALQSLLWFDFFFCLVYLLQHALIGKMRFCC